MARSSPAIRQMFAGLVAAALLAGCSRVTLVSRYDPATDEGITAFHGKLEGLLSQLDEEPVSPYATVKPSYDALRADLARLRLRNEARPKNELTVRQLEELRAAFTILEEQHRNDSLNRAMIEPTRDALRRACGAILKLELAKRELDE